MYFIQTNTEDKKDIGNMIASVATGPIVPAITTPIVLPRSPANIQYPIARGTDTTFVYKFKITDASCSDVVNTACSFNSVLTTCF